jgi:hypothetical protein
MITSHPATKWLLVLILISQSWADSLLAGCGVYLLRFRWLPKRKRMGIIEE